MGENEKHWFVIHTYSGHEERVKKNLEQRIKLIDSGDDISQILVPTEEEVEVRGGQRRTIAKKMLPGYVLVKMKMSDQSWNIVRNTPGVTGFVGSGNKPVPLKEEEVSQILKQMETADAEIVTVYYGDSVSAREAETLSEQIRETFPKQEIEIVSGGQPHYHYIISVE